MKLKEYKIKEGAMKSWREIFQNPCDIILESFKTGSVNINRRGTINIKHPKAGYIKDEMINVPIFSHLIKHNKFGYYLIDTGLDATYTYDPYGGVKGKYVDKFFQEKNENIGFHLENKGINLKNIFLSHLHPDHIAGVRELPKEIPYIVGKGEIEQYKPEIYGDFLKDINTLYEIDFSTLNKIPPLGPSTDLFGDGSFWAISTPGHTKGHISYLINGIYGPILLTMDASFIGDNLLLKIAPSDYTEDIALAQKTLENICEFLLEYPQVKVLAGHELL
ncbi:MAG: MBL fold metallo-hydrolase [Methanobacterium sp.]|nr:MBL fold metallo-hydrolase [Methanobacterium sp.]